MSKPTDAELWGAVDRAIRLLGILLGGKFRAVSADMLRGIHEQAGAALTQLRQQDEGECMWRWDPEPGRWHTGCDYEHWTHGFFTCPHIERRFCPFCGKRIKETEK